MRVVPKNSHPRGVKPSFTEYWRTLWRKKHFVIIPVVLAAGVAVVGVRFLSPIYMASALISIEERNYLSSEVAQFVTSERERRQVEDEDTLAKIDAEIHSSAFLSELVLHLGLHTNTKLIAGTAPSQPDTSSDVLADSLLVRKLASKLKSKFKVTLDGPGMFDIACYDLEPEACYILANAATDVFIETQRERKVRGLKQASQFGDQQLAVYKTRLEKSELELERVQRRMAQDALDDNAVNEQSLRDAQRLRQQLNTKVDEIDGILEKTRLRLASAIGTVPTGQRVWNDPETRKLQASLSVARENEIRLELGGRFINTKDWANSEAGILALEGTLQRHLTSVVAVSYPEINADHKPLLVEYLFQVAMIESWRAQRDKLESSITSFRAKLDLMPVLETELAALKEEVRTDRELYNSFLRAKTSTQISEAATKTGVGGDIVVIERPTMPSYPVRPNKMGIVILAVLFGGAFGFAGILLSEYADSSFRKVDEIEELLGLRVLGTIPRFESEKKWNHDRLTRRVAIWAVAGVVLVVVSLYAFYRYGKSIEGQTLRVSTSSLETGSADK